MDCVTWNELIVTIGPFAEPDEASRAAVEWTKRDAEARSAAKQATTIDG